MREPAKGTLKQFLQQDDGSTAIEYALIASVTAVAILAGLPTVGPTLNDFFLAVIDGLNIR
jgi:Flp pilus assembly pilin Flp